MSLISALPLFTAPAGCLGPRNTGEDVRQEVKPLARPAPIPDDCDSLGKGAGQDAAGTSAVLERFCAIKRGLVAEPLQAAYEKTCRDDRPDQVTFYSWGQGPIKPLAKLTCDTRAMKLSDGTIVNPDAITGARAFIDSFCRFDPEYGCMEVLF